MFGEQCSKADGMPKKGLPQREKNLGHTCQAMGVDGMGEISHLFGAVGEIFAIEGVDGKIHMLAYGFQFPKKKGLGKEGIPEENAGNAQAGLGGGRGWALSHGKGVQQSSLRFQRQGLGIAL